jgi:menaquinone-dependent protoporphyrinogen IX oxidase
MHTLTIKVAKISDMKAITDCIAEKLGLVVVHMDVGTETVTEEPKKVVRRKRNAPSRTLDAVLSMTVVGKSYKQKQIKSYLVRHHLAETSWSGTMSKLIKTGHFTVTNKNSPAASYTRVK